MKPTHIRWSLLVIFCLVCALFVILRTDKSISSQPKTANPTSNVPLAVSTDNQSISPENKSASSGPTGSLTPLVMAPLTAQPVSIINGHPVAYPGAFAVATIKADGKSYKLTPNQLGHFSRVFIQPKDKVSVQLSYPQGHVGDPVSVEVEDGGTLNKEMMALVNKLDEHNSIQFNFQTTENPGIYRLAIHNGSDVKVLNFWAGKDTTTREE